jgi:hypothetical protein
MALDRTCTASQLVARLQALIAEHGDLPVYARDADTHWRLPIGLMFRAEQPQEERPARFEITTDYNERPRSDFEEHNNWLWKQADMPNNHERAAA